MIIYWTTKSWWSQWFPNAFCSSFFQHQNFCFPLIISLERETLLQTEYHSVYYSVNSLFGNHMRMPFWAYSPLLVPPALAIYTRFHSFAGSLKWSKAFQRLKVFQSASSSLALKRRIIAHSRELQPASVCSLQSMIDNIIKLNNLY